MPLSNSKNSDLENQVHVWFCYPDEVTDAVKLDGYRSILSVEENQRQQRFYSAEDQHSYLVSHALVRKVLSMYCDVMPERWLFTFNQHGKPEVSAEIVAALDCPPIKFNLSHTSGLTACVVSLNDECGVDVENIQRKNKLLSIAERMFAEPELVTLRDISDAEMRNKFFDYWTLREAYVKALGSGLKGSSKQFYFNINPHDGAERVAEICFTDKDIRANNSWQFSLLKPSTEHIIAVALQSNDSIVKKIVCQKIQP